MSFLLIFAVIAVFAAGTAVLTYWIYRVRVMHISFIPFRHSLQISMISVLSTIVFFFLIKVETRLLMIVLILVLSSLLVALELFLRKVSGSANKEIKKYRISQGKNGIQVKYSEAREASGDYPRAYMTESFFKSFHYITMCDGETSPKNKKPSNHFTVTNGIRETSDQPKLWSSKLMFLGGSTTFAREVPDDLTFASYVQRKINLGSGGVKVINHGKEGATVIDRVNWLINESQTNPGDMIVIYFGCNDCGWQIRGKFFTGDQFAFQSPLLFVLNRYKNRAFELLNWLHGELAHRHNKWCADHVFKQTVSELQRAKEWAEFRGLKYLVVLQPHVYVSKVVTQYENSLRGRFSFFLPDQLRIAYPRYEEFIKNCGYGVSLTTIYDGLDHSVYLDWAHVNARGNEVISENLYREIKNRNWL